MTRAAPDPRPPDGWGDDEPVELVPHDPRWGDRFDEERRLLEPALAPWLEGGIHHVGSTAIPGVPAKPIVDVMAGVRSLGEARDGFGVLARLEYLYAPYRPDEFHWFCKPSPAARTHHLILVEPTHPTFAARLAFRDHLRRHADVARAYAQLKERLAREHRHDREAYTDGKAAFVAAVVERELGAR